MKIAVISHAFVQEVPRKRWRILAEKYGHEVHIIVPKKWYSTWFGNKRTFKVDKVRDNNFYIHPLATTSKKKWWQYFFLSFDMKLRQIKPDIIYIIHEEGIWVHQQIYLYRKLFAPNAKIIFFSMNARGVYLKRFYHRWMWQNLINNVEAAVVHYPGCLQSLRKAGFKKPIYIQTQVGVDEELFKPNPIIRKEMRKELNIENKFVIGYSGRLISDKGVDDLINALPIPEIDWYLILVGDGPLKKDIEEKIKKENWQNRILITSDISQELVPKYMNAMDCFVLASKTTPHWIDTFPLVTVQAMACKVPVICSDSASLPWQAGDCAMIFPEGDSQKIRDSIVEIAKNESLRDDLSEKGNKRSLANFCVKGLTRNFDKIMNQVLKEKIEIHQPGESYKQYKAYE
jgi:glycosyltransferase involved in cell wall biosynthesis